jgi:hypothetical protein
LKQWFGLITMKFNLNVVLNIEGTNVVQGGEFYAKRKEDIAGIANEWIRKIKMDTGYRDTVIVEVLVNSETDITEEVRNYIPG